MAEGSSTDKTPADYEALSRLLVSIISGLPGSFDFFQNTRPSTPLAERQVWTSRFGPDSSADRRAAEHIGSLLRENPSGPQIDITDSYASLAFTVPPGKADM